MNRFLIFKTIGVLLVIMSAHITRAQKGFVWDELGNTLKSPNNITGDLNKCLNGEIYLFRAYYGNDFEIIKWNGSKWLIQPSLSIGKYMSWASEGRVLDAELFNNLLYVSGYMTRLNLSSGGAIKRKHNTIGILQHNGNGWDTLMTYPQNPDSLNLCTQTKVYKNNLFYIARFWKRLSDTTGYNYYSLYKYSSGGATSLIATTKKKDDIFTSLEIVNGQLLLGGKFDSIGNIAINSGLAIYDGSGFSNFKNMPFSNVVKLINRNDTDFLIGSDSGLFICYGNGLIKNIDTSKYKYSDYDTYSLAFTFYSHFIFRGYYDKQLGRYKNQYYDLDSSKWFAYTIPDYYLYRSSISGFPVTAGANRAILIGSRTYSFYDRRIVALELKPGAVLSGRMFADKDSNCIYDTTDVLFKKSLVKISKNGNQFLTTTDATGKYEISLSAGVYKIEPVLPQTLATFPCLKDSVMIATQAILNYDLPVKTDKKKNLGVSLTTNRPYRTVPGTEDIYYLTCSNYSFNSDSFIVKLKYSNKLTLISSDITPYSNTTNELTYKFYNLTFDSPQVVTLKFKTDNSRTKLGDSILLYSGIVNSSGDYLMKNNFDTLRKIAVSSYDPNEKKCDPSGAVKSLPGKIRYTIYFQNTGNYMAYNVRVTDVLSGKLELGSTRIIASSHYNILHFYSEDKTLVFDFSGINLPDSGTDQEKSHGYVTFEVDVKGTLPVGDSITNKASIYFDFNAPVITNTASVKLIKDNSGINPIHKFNKEGLGAFPNPANESLTIEGETQGFNDRTTVKVINILGEIIDVKIQKIDAHQITIDVSHLLSGVYTILINQNSAIKFLKQ